MQNKYELIPKKKSEVQFNGEKKFSTAWTKPYLLVVEKEFDERFDELKKKYDGLIDEIQLNNLIYNSEIKFEPVIGNIYYLYKRDDDSFFLSIIAPWEWRMSFVVAVKFNHNGKWEKIDVIF